MGDCYYYIVESTEGREPHCIRIWHIRHGGQTMEVVELRRRKTTPRVLLHCCSRVFLKSVFYVNCTVIKSCNCIVAYFVEFKGSEGGEGNLQYGGGF